MIHNPQQYPAAPRSSAGLGTSFSLCRGINCTTERTYTQYIPASSPPIYFFHHLAKVFGLCNISAETLVPSPDVTRNRTVDQTRLIPNKRLRFQMHRGKANNRCTLERGDLLSCRDVGMPIVLDFAFCLGLGLGVGSSVRTREAGAERRESDQHGEVECASEEVLDMVLWQERIDIVTVECRWEDVVDGRKCL
jgi:hypothetical protein